MIPWQKISKRTYFLILCDTIAISLSLTVANFLWCGSWEIITFKLPHFYLTVVIFLILFYIFDLYDPFKYFKPAQTLADIVISVSLGMVVAAVFAYVKRSFAMPRLSFVYAACCLILLIFLIRLIYDALFKSRILQRKTIIIGGGALAHEIAECIKNTPNSGMSVLGLVMDKVAERKFYIDATVPVLGDISDIASIVDLHHVEFVVLALSKHEVSTESQIMENLLRRKTPVVNALQLYENIKGEVAFRHLDAKDLITLVAQMRTRAYLKVKRLTDIVSSLILLVLLSPIFSAAVFALFAVRSKVFFIQSRIGKNGNPFRLIKLCSMNESDGGQLSVTRLGYYLRKYRIDEIPQLFNVIMGDMSLIGPRPEIPFFVSRCRKEIPFYDLVFSLRPGITGWAQVKFRYTTTMRDYEQKFQFNLYYIKNVSFPLDLLIMLKTIRVILLGKGE